MNECPDRERNQKVGNHVAAPRHPSSIHVNLGDAL